MAYTKAQLQSWQKREERKISAEERKQKQLDEEIDRLQRAYRRVLDLKDGEAVELKNKTKVKNATQGYEWRGDNKNKYDEVFDENAYPDSKKLISKDLDDMADEIRWEINDKKDQRDDSSGIVRACKKTIRYIGTLFDTLTN